MAQRVNTKFLAGMVIVVAAAGILAAAIHFLVPKGNAKEIWALGDKHFAAKEFTAAREAYVRALRVDPMSFEGRVKLGDVNHELSQSDPDLIGQDVKQWESALEVNPSYLPALRKLLDAYVEVMDTSNDIAWFTRVRDKARAVLRVDPADQKAMAYELIASVRAWVLGASGNERDVEKDLAAITDLIKQKNPDPALVWAAATGYIKLANNHEVSKDSTGAQKYRDLARRIYETAIASDPKNPTLTFKYYEVCRATIPPMMRYDEAVREMEGLVPLIDLARKLSKPEDQDYVAIHIVAAQFLRQREQTEEAEKVLKDLIDARPDDMTARLEQARIWRSVPDKHAAAIELLSKETGKDPTLKGFRAARRREFEFARLTSLAAYKLDDWDSTPAEQRPKLLLELDDLYNKAVAAIPHVVEEENIALVKIKGRILTYQGGVHNHMEAIRLLRRVYDLQEKNEYRALPDYELMMTLAKLYMATSESGQYRDVLTRIVQLFPTVPEPRKQLAAELIREKLYKQAKVHVDWLEQRGRDPLDTVRFRIQIYQGEGQTDSIRALVNSIPTATDSGKFLKAAAYVWSDDLPGAEKILAALSADELTKADTRPANAKPGNQPASQMLAKVLLKMGRKDEAVKVAQAILRIDPKDPTRKIFVAMINGTATPEEIQKIQNDAIVDLADPVQQALQTMRVRRMEKKDDEALKVLIEADKANPNSGLLVETLFNLYLEMGKFDQAEVQLARLKELNWDRADGLYFQTRMLLIKGDADKALSSALDLTKRSAEFSRSWVALGQAQQAKGEMEPALASFERAISMQPDSLDALRGQIECHVELKQYELAKERVQRAQALHPGIAYFAEVGRRLEELTGDPLLVTKEREEELKKNPKIVGYWIALADNYQRVSDSMLKKNPKGADEYQAKAVATLREAQQTWPADGAIASRLADLAVRANNPQQAIRIIEDMAAQPRWQKRPEPQVMLARLYQRLGKDYRQRTEEALRTAVDYSENSVTARLRLAEFYVETLQDEKALVIFRSLEKSENDPTIRRRLIQVLIAAGKHEEAESMLKGALAQAPNDPALLSLYGFVLMVKNDPQGAEKQFALALAADPRFAQAVYYRGMLRKSTGNVGAAVTDLRTAVNLAPNYVEYRLGLSDALRQRSQIDDACKELEAAVYLAPMRKDLRERLIRIYQTEGRWDSMERILDNAKQNPELAREAIWWRLEAKMWLIRSDPKKAMEAIQVAMKMEQSDPDVIYTYLEILQNAKLYDNIINLTEPHVNGPNVGANGNVIEKPYWLFMARAAAYVGKGQKEKAVGVGTAPGEYDRALSAIDLKKEDDAAGVLVNHMASHVGLLTVIDKLKDRNEVRWEIQLVTAYMDVGRWQDGADLLDRLLGPEFTRLTANQQMFVLQRGGQTYAAAASRGIAGAHEKALATGRRYIKELERTRGAVQYQMDALNNMASLLLEDPNFAGSAETLDYAQRAFNIMTEMGQFLPNVADTYGWALVQNGKIAEGIRILRDASAYKNAPPDVWYHMGVALMKQKQYDEARRAFDSALKLIAEYRTGRVFFDESVEPKVKKMLEELEKVSPSKKDKDK